MGGNKRKMMKTELKITLRNLYREMGKQQNGKQWLSTG
jgi:hypothetical protein